MAMAAVETCSLNEDVISEILTRLPQKTLCRCKCISKSWKSLISEPSFISRYAIRSKSLPPLLTGVFYTATSSPFYDLEIGVSVGGGSLYLAGSDTHSFSMWLLDGSSGTWVMQHKVYYTSLAKELPPEFNSIHNFPPIALHPSDHELVLVHVVTTSFLHKPALYHTGTRKIKFIDDGARFLPYYLPAWMPTCIVFQSSNMSKSVAFVTALAKLFLDFPTIAFGKYNSTVRGEKP